MREFKIYLKEELLLEAKVDDYVNRYMKHHADHPMMKSLDPDYAKTAIRSTHGIGSNHHENVFLTRGVIGGHYIPHEDEETMRATLGTFRRAVQQGYMKKEEIADHDHNSLNRVFEAISRDNPDFDPTEAPIKGNPEIRGLEKYKVGTVMPHPNTESKRIDPSQPMHVYHIHHSDVLRDDSPQDEYRRLSKTIKKNCPAGASICVRNSPEHLQRYSTGHGFFAYAQGGRIVRAHGYGDPQGIVDHKNGQVSEEESEHLMDATSGLLSKKKKFMYNLSRVSGTNVFDGYHARDRGKYVGNLFAGMSHHDMKEMYDEEARNHKKSLEQSKTNPAYYPIHAAKSAYKEPGQEFPYMPTGERLQAIERRYGPRDFVRMHLDNFSTKKSEFLDSVHTMISRHLEQQIDNEGNPTTSGYEGTPIAHPDFIRHVVMHGRGMNLEQRARLENAFISSPHFRSGDLDVMMDKHEDSVRKQKQMTKKMMSLTDLRGKPKEEIEDWTKNRRRANEASVQLYPITRERSERFRTTSSFDSPGYYHTGTSEYPVNASDGRILNAVHRGAKEGWLTKDQMHRAWNLPMRRSANFFRRSLIATGSPHITSEMIDDELLDKRPPGPMSGSGKHYTSILTHTMGEHVFKHPNHTREHVDYVLGRLDNILKTNPDYHMEVNRANEAVSSALMHSHHINDDDIHRMVTHPDLSIKIDRDTPENYSLNKTAKNTRDAAFHRVDSMLKGQRSLKPEHITQLLSNPHIDRQTLNYVGNRKDLTPQHEHMLLDLADKEHAIGKEGWPRHLHWASSYDHDFLENVRSPSAIHRIIRTIPRSADRLFRDNPNVDASHMDAVDSLFRQGKIDRYGHNQATKAWADREEYRSRSTQTQLPESVMVFRRLFLKPR